MSAGTVMTSAAPIGESFSVAIASGVADAGAAFALGENPRVDSTSANCFAGATTLSGAALRSTNSSIAAAQAALDASGKRKGSGGTERSTSSTLSAPAGTGGKGNVKSKKSNSKKQKITPVAGARSAATISAEAAGERERTNERKWLQPPTSTTKLTHQIRSARLVRSAQRRKCQQC